MKTFTEEKKITTLIGCWLGTIRANKNLGYLDITKASETLASKLLNLIFNLELKNLNEVKNNFPAIDLGDIQKGIAFQITSQDGSKKISESLKKYVSNAYYKQYPKIKFLILNSKKPKFRKEYTQIYPQFTEEDILDEQDIIHLILKIYENDPATYSKIDSLLTNEIYPMAFHKKGIEFSIINLKNSSEEWKETEENYFSDLYKDVKYHFERIQYADIDPIFDVTIMNYENDPVIISAIGVEIDSLASFMTGRGGNEPYKIKLKHDDLFILEIGNIFEYFSSLPESAYTRNEFCSSDNIPFAEVYSGFKILKKINLQDPILIPPKIPYRFLLWLGDFQSLHHTILKLVIDTSDKLFKSEKILLSI